MRGGLPPAPLLDYSPPVYAPAARENRGIVGDVILELMITANSHVGPVRILRGVGGLNEAAVAAVKTWQFATTCLNGQAVAVVQNVVIHFPPE